MATNKPVGVERSFVRHDFKVAPLDLRWQTLSVTINRPRAPPVLALQPCSGAMETGSLLAAMGPSGGGKTTLLNALAHRGPSSGGEVLYGGSVWSARLKRRVGVVEQDDQVLQQLTVGESLRFAAALRLSHLTPAAREARVASLLAILRLASCEGTQVGDSTSAASRGISGGERKRLCIACELLTMPSLLFLDEPSSGLDSSMAYVRAVALSSRHECFDTWAQGRLH